MRKFNPYRNIFYYYRGPSKLKDCLFDTQIEDNSTKALINTLENSRNDILLAFLEEVNIRIRDFRTINYNLQVVERESRPDGIIEVDDCRILIESKICSPLEKPQIINHLQCCDGGYLLCITPREKDESIISEINAKNLRFITWQKVYSFFKAKLEKALDKRTYFVIQQFLAYLEAINMSPFTDWDKNDFEAFLNIEDDPDRQLRLRVKDKLALYLNELKEKLNEERLFSELLPYVGNIKQESEHVWGVLCSAPLQNRVHKAHFNFWVDSDQFGMGVLMEGKAASHKMERRMGAEKVKILKILKELNDYFFIISKRVNTSGRPRDYHGVEVFDIKTGDDMRMEDIDYIIVKLKQFNLCEIHLIKEFKRDAIKPGQQFIKKSVEFMRQMKDFHDFACGL